MLELVFWGGGMFGTLSAMFLIVFALLALVVLVRVKIAQNK